MAPEGEGDDHEPADSGAISDPFELVGLEEADADELFGPAGSDWIELTAASVEPAAVEGSPAEGSEAAVPPASAAAAVVPHPPVWGVLGGHGVADACVHLDRNCVLRMYTYSQHVTFEATCGNPLHGRCRRTATGVKENGVYRSGRTHRPLGMLLAWLAVGYDCPGREGPDGHKVFEPTREDRVRARRDFIAENRPALPLLLGGERPHGEGEDEEPW